MENELSILETEEIQNLIYTIRGKQVMLDSDVAMLYHYETKRINETVRRNIKRFPKNFGFQLDDNDLDILRSQFATASIKDLGNKCFAISKIENMEFVQLLMNAI